MKNLGDIGKGKHNTYVILIDGFSLQKGRYGVYVGETSKSPEERFIEHQTGIRSGKGTKERSIQLMKTLMPFYQFKRQNKDHYETYLHHSLAQTLVKEPYYLSVKGNTNWVHKIDDYSIKYNFEDLKQELFNKSVKKILDESKSIIIDPNEIKKMFNNKSFNPNSILDLFEN